MNKSWFNSRLRMIGKTAGDLADAIGRDRAVVSRILNGHQDMSLDQAKIFADLLGVDISEVLQQAGLAEGRVAQAFRAGYVESDAAEYEPSGHEAARHIHIKQAFSVDRDSVSVWRMKSNAMAVGGLLDGDFLLVDRDEAERARAGDLVVAQLFNNANGTATTVVRRFEPPVLVAAAVGNEYQRVQVVDGVNVVIRGRVVVSWRE